jgi:hypothetical protein
MRESLESLERAWKWATGSIGDLAKNAISLSHAFRQDEGAKWFGLHIEKHEQIRISRIIETPRFDLLASASLHEFDNSPKRQFPSLISFVGDTGAGKSTISIFYHPFCVE